MNHACDRADHAPRSSVGWRFALIGALWLSLITGLLTLTPVAAHAATCTGNAVVCENQKTGSPSSEWDVAGAGDPTIQGFSTDISVNVGSTVSFKIDTNAAAYTISIYRMGWYGGDGARKIDTFTPNAALAHDQPACATDPTTEIYDCGTWRTSASWSVPDDAVSGVYFALLTRTDTGGASHIVFVVRDDASTSALVMQTSDSTWQAYNTYGGSDFYQGAANGRAYKVSYNRPVTTRGETNGRDFVFANEYPMIRFLEQNGYDVSYVSGIDTATNPRLLVNANGTLKHKTFMTVGHDEYWTKSQRANVLAARDAGVNLAFFSGNDMYWKTRLEKSEDGNNTDNRTLVCYKDTWAGTRIDPVEATATWRDPRFGNLGFGPENQLLGTQYMANSVDLALKVDAREGKLRLWRGTELANQASGSVTTLADHTIGYESNEDVDNGFRPAGLIRLSTSTGETKEYLQDYGKDVAPGTTTHHLTQYRAASGALVFSAGTIQWSWGLDSHHDATNPLPADVRIRQATANVLADMDVAPTTLASDLTMPSKTTDTAAPSVSISAPQAGTTVQQGSRITVSGTATDAAGQVAGVEVSVDGGLSWHPATGTTSWSYSGILTGNGSTAIQVRAADDSSNLGTPVTLAVNSPCPCTLFGLTTPSVPDTGDDADVTLGTRFTASTDGYITGVRFYKSAANVGTHTGSLYAADGTRLATGTFADETASGWQTLTFPAVRVTAGTVYVAAYRAPSGHYAGDARFYDRGDFSSGILTAPGGVGEDNGVYALGDDFPTRTYQHYNYYVGPIWSPTDTTPVTLVRSKPSAGSSSVALSTTVTATLSKAVAASDIAISLADASGAAVPADVTWSDSTRTVTLTPRLTLSPSAKYWVTLNAVGMAAAQQWSFTTAAADTNPDVCPCSIFDDADHPASGPVSDTDNVQLGMAFTSEKPGQVTGIRFYKNAENIGTHTIALWKGTTKLAEATVTGETTSGWQEAQFSAPVPISAGTTYVASYTAPVGRYGYTRNGLAAALTSGPLSTPAGAGRYSYSSGALGGTSNTNYYVDPVVEGSADAAPEVVTVSPGDEATSVPVARSVTATFSTSIQPGTAKITLTNKATGAVVAGTSSNESQGVSATFTPTSDLAAGTAYTVTVSGAKSLGGTAMTKSVSSTFTTSGPNACPCSLMESTTVPASPDSDDTSAVTLGIKVKPTVDGVITGLRYYRGDRNTGTHTGTLWSSSGAQLATVTFTDSGTGWQQASFATPVRVTAGTTYVAGYYAPKGHYAADLHAFDTQVSNPPLASVSPGGVYALGDAFPQSSYLGANYYVDVVFTTADTTPPQVTDIDPGAGTVATVDTTVSATFDRAVKSTATVTVETAAGAAVAGQTRYDADSRTVTFTPSADLAASTTYSVTVRASSTSGVAMDPKTWTFSTSAPAPQGVEHSLFGTDVTPSTPAWADDGAVEVGLKFSSSVAGKVTAIRFYAGEGNTGTQVVTLWGADGTALATGKSKSTQVGWRTVTFATPVSITAGTTYTASYYAPTGHYGVTAGTFGGTYTNGPLSVEANGSVYRYPSGFPSSGSRAWYGVDVVVVTAS